MFGSTIVFEPEKEKLFCLVEDLDRLDEFQFIDLDVMNSLDFTLACRGTGNWLMGDPLFVGDGLVIAQVSPKSLRHVLGHSAEYSEEKRPDIDRLTDFVSKNGVENIWEISTC